MALTKTVDEIEEMLPNFVSNLNDPDAFPNFRTAEYKHLVPVTGIALYNDIHNKYNNAPGTMTEEEEELLKRMRLVAVSYAYAESLAMGLVKWADVGAIKPTQGGTSEVKKWEFEQSRSVLLNMAADGTEVLLGYLFEIEPELWTASAEYKSINALLIKTASDFNAQYGLFQPMRTFFSIKTVIADAQELLIKDAIGEDLLDLLISAEDPDEKLEKEIGKLKKSLAFLTIKLCIDQFTVRFSSEGFTVLGGTDSIDSADHFGRQSASSIDISAKQNACEKNGMIYLNKAIAGLVAYYKRTETPMASDEFKAALDAGPLASMIEPSSCDSVNNGKKGIYRM